MGCLQLTYRTENSLLQVAWNSLQEGEKSCTGNYRFGFNGMEMDNEWSGSTGTHLNFGARIYDSRVGRWLSTDPLQEKYPSLSPYNFVANSPIMFIDPDGRKIKGASSVDAEKFHATLNKVFAGKDFDEFRSLLTRGKKNNKAMFDKIDSEQLESAIKNLGTKEAHLARMVSEAINQKGTVTISYLKITDKISNKSDVDMIKNVVKETGNEDFKTFLNACLIKTPIYTENGEITGYNEKLTTGIISLNGGAMAVESGKNSSVFMLEEKIDATIEMHEVIGHGLPIMKGYSEDANDDHAVRTTNLVNDVMGGDAKTSTGANHNPNGRLTPNPNKLP